MYAKNAWEKYDDKQIEKIMDFNEGLLKQLMQDIKI